MNDILLVACDANGSFIEVTSDTRRPICM